MDVIAADPARRAARPRRRRCRSPRSRSCAVAARAVAAAVGLPEPRPRVIARCRRGRAARGRAARARGDAAADRVDVRPARCATDAEAFVVIDTSRSMLARSSPRSTIRYARARAAALRFRDAFADVPVGIASFTDRVLPHLFPSADDDVFVATLRALDRDRPAAAAGRRSSRPRRGSRRSRRSSARRYFSPTARSRLARRDHGRRERAALRREDRGRVPAPARRRHGLPPRLGRRRARLRRGPGRSRSTAPTCARAASSTPPRTRSAATSSRRTSSTTRSRKARELARRGRDGRAEGEQRNRLALAPVPRRRRLPAARAPALAPRPLSVLLRKLSIRRSGYSSREDP